MSRPLPLRPVRDVTRHPDSRALSVAELQRRATWGGMLGVPELTADQRAAWDAHRRAQSDWHPQRALWYAWAAVDAMHGSRRWSRAAFRAALAEDRRAIAAVINAHPRQAARLHTWVGDMERLADAREADPEAGGQYYEQLQGLGYDSTAPVDERSTP